MITVYLSTTNKLFNHKRVGVSLYQISTILDGQIEAVRYHPCS